VERVWELTALEECLNAAGAEIGSSVFVEAPTGGGKSSLLTAAGEIARRCNVRVLAAAGKALERDFPFGLALQLFEPLWWAAGTELRRQLLDGPAQRAASLLTDKQLDGPPDDNERHYPVIHGLFWVTQNLLRSLSHDQADGLALIVDDAHWADALSLRFLAYLADRAQELPIAIIVAARAGERSTDPQALATIRRAAGASLVRPGALSGEAVGELVVRRFPGADPAFCLAFARVTGGNPFLVGQLLDELDRRELDPMVIDRIALAEIVPEKVRDSVAAQLDAMQPSTRRVAQSVAVFGDGASVRRVARLAELSSRTVLVAADALVSMQLLSPGIPMSFLQPLIRSAVLASLPPFERSQAHLTAARILAERQASVEEIGWHLLNAPANDDPGAIGPLRAAAALALDGDDPEQAIVLLVRALAEHPAPELRAELLTELAGAEAQAGHPEAGERLSEARRISEDPGRRAELALTHGKLLYTQGRYREAADVLAEGRRDFADTEPRFAAQLTAAYVSVASLVGELQPAAMELRNQLVGDLAGPPSELQRSAIAHTVVQDGLLGTPRMQITRLAELAWGDGAMLTADRAFDLDAPLLCAGLVCADELERTVEISGAVLSVTASRQPLLVNAIVRCARAWAFYHQGRLAEAEADAHAALHGHRDASSGFVQSALALIACCHIERGHLQPAENVLVSLERQEIRDSIAQALRLNTRAQLRLAQHRPQEALQDAVSAGLLINSRIAGASPGVIPWRSTAALAHLALGEVGSARTLAEEELAEARRIDLTRIVIRDLRILGLALNSDGIEKLAEAVAIGDSAPRRLEHVRSLVDYGAALRRKNRRADAREPLRRGLDLSHKGGASVLESVARIELIATGARPRRHASSGVDSLTVSQRRVAELAARGLTTRQIAETLFVTPKTVEFHLRQTYVKLAVSSREELAAALNLV
jgi:DNA-binding CsgD family transcriptional regulator